MFVEGKPRTVFFLQTLYFTAFIATVEKIITYALGEHDPGSAQNWRTSNDFCSPAERINGGKVTHKDWGISHIIFGESSSKCREFQ